MFGRTVRTALMTGTAVIGLTFAAATPAVAQSGGAAAPKVEAPPPVIAPGNAKVKVTLGGWLNRAVSYADNGADDDILFTDNNGASSRILLTAVGKVNDTLTVGSVMELEAISMNSRTSGIDAASNAVTFNERKLEVYLDFANVGRVWLGQGDMASNVISEVDLSRTANLGLYSDVGATFGGFNFARSDTGAAGPSINAALPNYDGLNRDDRVRFDTISFAGGFVISASASDEGNTDIALRHTTKIGTASVSMAAGYADYTTRGSTTLKDLMSTSVSVLLANGFNATLAAGAQDFRAGTRSNGGFMYGKLGYVAKLNTLGDTAFSIDYFDGSDTVANGDDSDAIGFSVVQYLTAVNSELYVSARNHQYDAATVNYDNVFALMAGARVRF